MVQDIQKGDVLVLGDGNFSFSAALCRWVNLLPKQEYDRNCLTTRVSVVATVKETREELKARYSESEECVRVLEERGAKLLHGVDATRLDKLRDEEGNRLQFDHIVFNFPHVGGKTNLRKSRELLRGVFESVRNALTSDGRFYLTLANGQSGLSYDQPCENELPCHSLDSWQPLHLAAYSQLIAHSRKPFPVAEWASYGYQCAGYKNTSRRFRVEGAETLIFRQAKDSLSIDTMSNITPESVFDRLHPLRPYFVHDIAFWISDSFQTDVFIETIVRLTKGLVKRVSHLPEYSCYKRIDDEDQSTSTRTSLCFRLIWQSINYALTREAARDLQLLLRDQLPPVLMEEYAIRIELR